MVNCKKRLQFVKEYLDWTVEDWKRVIWTDESSFETGKRSRLFVIRTPTEKYCPDCLSMHMHSGRSSVMVWGAISGHWASRLVRVQATLKQTARKKGYRLVTVDVVPRPQENANTSPRLSPDDPNKSRFYADWLAGGRDGKDRISTRNSGYWMLGLGMQDIRSCDSLYCI